MLVFLKLPPGCRKQDRKVIEEAKVKRIFDSPSGKKKKKRGIESIRNQDTFLEGREFMKEGQASLKPSCWIFVSKQSYNVFKSNNEGYQ